MPDSWFYGILNFFKKGRAHIAQNIVETRQKYFRKILLECADLTYFNNISKCCNDDKAFFLFISV